MRTRRKALLLMMCAALLVAGSIIGTVAYLTDSDQVKNTFTVGKVSLTLDEAKVNEAGQPLKGDKVAAPNETADRWTPTENDLTQEYHLLPGHSYTKDPTVTVTAGSEDAYVRLLATISYNEKADAVFADTKTDDLFAPWLDINDAWKVVTPKLIKTEKTTDAETGKVVKITRTYEFRYKEVVGRSADATVLPALFTTLTVPESLDNDDIATLEGMEITVVANAIQSSGFVDANEAWAAFDAQNS